MTRFMAGACIACAVADALMGIGHAGPWAALAAWLAFSAGMRVGGEFRH